MLLPIYVKTNIAKVCVAYKDNTKEVATAATPVYIVDQIVSTSARNNEGEVGEKANVFVSKPGFGSDSVVSSSEGTFTGWGVGSVVKMLKNNYGDVKSTTDGSVLVWDVAASKMPAANEWINKPLVSINGTAYRTLVGVIESINPETGDVSFIPSTNFSSIDADPENPSKRENFTIKHTSESDCGFVVYDAAYIGEDPVYQITYEELEGTLTKYEDDPSNATEVLVHLTGPSSSLQPRLIYIIKR